MDYAVSELLIDPYRASNIVELSPRFKGKRRRGVVLSQQGWQKLEQAGVLCDRYGSRYTYEQLGERSLLDNRTVSRILSCETKVDKRTLKIFFEAFNLHLDSGDYAAPESQESLASTLTDLRIPEGTALKSDLELQAGKFLVIVASTDEDLRRVQQILQNAGQAVGELVAV